MSEPDNCLSTGEAANLLNISRSSASRMFDRGILQGKVNSITRERLISRESVLLMMKRYALPISDAALARKTILVGSANSELRGTLEQWSATDSRLSSNIAVLGADTLIHCSTSNPDMLILDDDLKDVGCIVIVSSLRRRPELQAMKILCCSRNVSPIKCLSAGADACHMMDAFDKVALKEQVYHLLDLSPEQDPSAKSSGDQRRWPRKTVNFPARLAVYRLSAPGSPVSGTATVQNINRGGASLSDFEIENNRLPEEPFRIIIQIDEAPLSDWQAHGQIVRLEKKKTLWASVKFTQISDSDIHKTTLLL